jgi:hypothetical protein
MSISVVARRLTETPIASNMAAGGKKTEHPIVRFRPRELYRLMALRHGRKLPMDQAGQRFAARMLDTFAVAGDAGRQRAANFLTLRCPWMLSSERSTAIDLAFGAKKYWSAEALGNDLDVTEVEHAKARIRTFRIAGMTDAAMAARRKAKEAARKQRERRNASLHPRKEPPLPAVRAEAIAGLLQPGERCTARAISDELTRTRHIRFAHMEGKALTTAVHNAIEFGIKQGILQKDIEPGSRMPIAWISRQGRTP